MRGRSVFHQNAGMLRAPAWIAGLVLAAVLLPAGANAWHPAKQPQAANRAQLAQHVPEVRQRCRWVKRCETQYNHEQRCEQVQQCQSGHCMPVPHCHDVAVPYQSCYPRKVCRP